MQSQSMQIRKGDPELIALVIQLYDETREKVFVATLHEGC